MLSILAALALATSVPSAQTDVSDPVQATCTVKFPGGSPMTAPCLVVAMRDAEAMGVSFMFDAETRLTFIGEPNTNGINVKLIGMTDDPYEATGQCSATEGKVACVASPVLMPNDRVTIQAVY